MKWDIHHESEVLTNFKHFIFSFNIVPFYKNRSIFFDQLVELIKNKYQDVEFWLIGWFQNSKYSINKNTLQKYVEKGVINLEAATPEENSIILESTDPDVILLLQQEDGSRAAL